MVNNTNHSAVGFHFQIKIDNETYSFKEVSGISAETSLEDVAEGGENRFRHKVPTGITYNDLEIKRGFVSKDSSLFYWVNETIDNDFVSKVKPKTIEVSLLNEDGNEVMTWIFVNAWPTAWNMGVLNGNNNEVLIESITFSYNYFTAKIIQ